MLVWLLIGVSKGLDVYTKIIYSNYMHAEIDVRNYSWPNFN